MIQGFVSYAHDDIDMARELHTHLRGVERAYGVTFWRDENLKAGQHFGPEIQRAIDAAQVILLLCSQNFLASDYINDQELPAIRVCAAQGKVPLIPVILRPCGWDDVFGPLQAVPTLDGRVRPITQWRPTHDGYDRARTQIRDTVKHAFKTQPKRQAFPNNLAALEQDKAGPEWLKSGDRFVRDTEGRVDDLTAASQPAARQHQASIAAKAAAFTRDSRTLHNMPQWQDCLAAAQQVTALLQGSEAEIVGALGSIRGLVMTLTSYRDMDRRLQRDPSQAIDPLDASLFRGLDALVDEAVLWLRQFPLIRTQDARLHTAPPDPALLAASRAWIGGARDSAIISAEDASFVLDRLRTGDAPPGEAESLYASIGATNLLYSVGGFSAGFLPGTQLPGPAEDVALAGKVTHALVANAPAIETIRAVMPSAVAGAVGRLVASARDLGLQARAASFDAKPPLPSPPDPPVPDDVEEQARALILAGQPPPESWRPFIRALSVHPRTS